MGLSSGNSVGVAISQPRVEGRSTSTLGIDTKKDSNSVGVAISRRRCRSRKSSTPTLDIDQLLRRGNHFSRKNDCHSLIFVYLCIEFTAAGALLVGFIYMKVIHPINGWEGEAPSMIIHH